MIKIVEDLKEFLPQLNACDTATCKFCHEFCTMYIEERAMSYTAHGLQKIIKRIITGEINPKDAVERIYRCTTCGYCHYVRCALQCNLDIIINARSWLIENGYVPVSIGKLLENLVKFNNPMGVSKELIDLEKLGVKDGKEGVEVLFYIGESRYDERNAKAVESAIRVLKAAGINFGVLREEANSGDLALRLGEIGLFEEFKEKNKEILEKYDMVVTFSPHDFHTFKNDYGLDNVTHISVFFKELIDDGKIKLKKGKGRAIYKDPCYLGRHNGIFDEPREIISSIMNLEEFDANRYFAICCGGGSGHVWLNLRKRQRASQILAQEIQEKNVDFVITACPVCTTMLEGENVKTLNISELIEKFLEV